MVRQWQIAADHPATLAFRGTDRGDSLLLAGPVLPQVLARTGGGPDTVYADGELPQGSQLVLGSGRGDYLSVHRTSAPLDQVNLDLAAQVLDFGTASTASRVRGVEHAGIAGIRVKVRGDDRDNHIDVQGCHLKATGGAGADRLTAYRSYGPACRVVGRLAGGPGPDHLYGSRGADVLLGGAGRDIAYGGGGIDVCRAEVTDFCNRS
jgi:Ca2+-binding RTX toxin-like protein